MSFVPVKLSEENSSRDQTDAGNSFHFSPAPMAIGLLQPRQVPDPLTFRQGFDFTNFTNYIEIQASYPWS